MSEELSPAEHFALGRLALVERRDALQKELDELNVLIRRADRMIELTGGTPKPKRVVRVPKDWRENGGKPTLRRLILSVLSDGQAHRYAEIAQAVSESGSDATDATVRGTVARMVRKNEIEATSRATYRLVTENASSPAGAGLDVGFFEEGGESDD